MRTLLLLAGLCAGLAVGRAEAQSVAGEWDAQYNTPGGVRTFKLVFQVRGDTLTGTVKRAAGDAALTGTVKGNEIRFSYAIDYNGNPLQLTITATVTGDTMQGKVDFGGVAEDDFSAKRAKAP